MASLAGLALVALTLSPAEASPEEAQEAYEAYEEGDFEEAATGYANAYLETDDPKYLMPLGDAQRRLGNHEKALHSYEIYLKYAEEDTNEAARARRLVEQLERAIRQEKLRTEIAPTRTPSQFNGANLTAEPVKSEKARPIGLYVSLASVAIMTGYTVVQVSNTERFEDQRDHAWLQIQRFEPEVATAIKGTETGSIIYRSCETAQSLSYPSSPNLHDFVSACQDGDKAARRATIGRIGMVAGFAATTFFGLKYWASSDESPRTVTPAVGPTGDGGVQGSVHVTF
jgi:tetratricopeptide (TPR) repeat protein